MADGGKRREENGALLDRLASEQSLVLLVVLLAALAWLIPVGVRVGAFDSLLVDAESYYWARTSHQMADFGVEAWDRVQDRPILLTPYQFYLSLFLKTFGNPLGYWMSTLFLAALSVGAIALLLHVMGIAREVSILALLIWILSPAYLRISLTLHPSHLGFVLVLWGVFFLAAGRKEDKALHYIFAAVLIFTSMFLGPFNLLLGVAVLVIASLFLKEPLLALLTLVALPAPLMQFRQISFTYPPLQPFFAARPFLPELLSDLGAPVGFATFAIFLAAVALFTAWKGGIPYNPAYLPALIISSAFLFFPRRFSLYFSVPLAALAAVGFLYLWKMEWELDIIRTLTIILIGCGILFTGLSYFNRAVVSSPVPDEVDTYRNFLSYPDGTVLSHEDNGFLLEYFSVKHAYLDGLHTSAWDSKKEKSDELYANRNLASAVRLLSEEDIRYVFVDPEMKSGQVWRKDDEGLLFILHDELTFDKLFTTESGEAWMLKERPEPDSPSPNIVYRSSGE